jgi:DNA-binding GntR family transcriptional regulator
MDASNPWNHIQPLPRGALRHEVVRRLMEAIFQGELPAGTRLVAKKLADRMGISPTPIREALVELESIGIIELLHNRGAVVRPFGPAELRDMYHVRRILESEAARCACGRLDRAALERCGSELRALLAEQDNDPQWFNEVNAADQRFHQMMAAGCGNARLAKEIDRYDGLAQTLREIIGQRRQVSRDTIDQISHVVEAMLAGDAEAAAGAMGRHLDEVAEAVLVILFPANS